MSQSRKTAVPSHAKHYFVTGFPDFLTKRLIQQIARSDRRGRLSLLVQPKFQKEAEDFVSGLGRPDLELFLGDVVDMHFGLSGDEYQRLCGHATDVFHLAAISNLGAPKDLIWRVNVEGTRNALELARDCSHLQRFNHFSTCYVSGDRVGVIAEDELDRGQGFRNSFEHTKFQAEKLVQRMSGELPVTIYRPSSLVGDSSTGEIDRFEGPYYLGILLVMSPLVVALPLPGDGVAPLNVVPADYVSAAVWALSRHPRAVGRTFHLVDPNPMSARRAYEMIAERANKRLPRFNLSARAADVMLRLPILEKLARPQRAAISYVNHLAIYNCHNTLELLNGSGIQCPPLATYLDKLMTYVQEYYRKRRIAAVEVDDPLDYPLPSRSEEVDRPSNPA
jgi:thioester reductase-like protein